METRLAIVKDLTLQRGKHKTFADGVCLLEAVAYVAGERHTDRPKCTCPVVSTLLRRWNDCVEDDQRQDLKRFIVPLIGSRSSISALRHRDWLASDFDLRVEAPIWLDNGGLEVLAKRLRTLAEINVLNFEKAQSIASHVLDVDVAAATCAYVAAGDVAKTITINEKNAVFRKLHPLILDLADRMLAIHD